MAINHRSTRSELDQLRLERLELDRCDWERMDRLPDREIFQTREWLEFVGRTQGAEPVVAAVLRGDERVGYFTGLIIRRFGVRVLGSPFPGWTTGSMGFNLDDGVGRRAALEALVPFAFRELGCLHLELKDRRLSGADFEPLGFRCSPFETFELDLTRDEEAIFAAMSRTCRWAIRRSAKNGVTIEEAHDEDFADEYYAQLEDVFAKQSLKPPYDAERVRELIRCIQPTGRMLLVRALSPAGDPIATAIFPAMNGTAWFWGGASWRSHQKLLPNEPVFWYAIRHWRARGMTVLDTNGGGDYKRKFGVEELTIPFARKSRVPGVGPLRDVAASLYTRSAFRGRRTRRSATRRPGAD